LAALGACAAALGAAGCGSSTSYKNDPRPPSPIVVSASIGKSGVSVSPAKIGAGPISLLVVNQTDTSQRVTLERTEVDKTAFQQQTSPINPHGTASLKADLDEGTYTVKVDGGAIKAAKVEVGAARPSAQNDLLQP